MAEETPTVTTPPITPLVTPPVTPPATETPPATPPATPPVTEPEPPKEPAVREKAPEVKPPDDQVDMLDPVKAKEYIDKTVKGAVSTVSESVHKQQVEAEVAAVLAQNPEYKPYEDRIRTFVNHPNRAGLIKNGLPVATVALEAVAPFLQKIGAEKARKADEAAKATADAGITTRPSNAGGGKPDFKNMSAKEIEKINADVKAGRYQG